MVFVISQCLSLQVYHCLSVANNIGTYLDQIREYL